uniref:UDENN domain-containing protein n=1 Tax=Macrostomum lignano TaxID=282301 RepID=A0A1I8FS01_9PLAT
MSAEKPLCPRLLDYVVLIGARLPPARQTSVSQTPDILRRYPPQITATSACHPTWPSSASRRAVWPSAVADAQGVRDSSTFVFTLTEKDSGLVRYGICLNFYRTIDKRWVAAEETVWSVLTGLHPDCSSAMILRDVREIETWILRLLSAPVPLTVLPESDYPPLLFALPDRSRLSLADFPLHLPLELLGVDTCLQVLTCILLENKVLIQSRDENALTMSVLAFVAMLYPMQYMFPVIPCCPPAWPPLSSCCWRQTPYIIGVPASFLLYKKNFCLPSDVWLVDLDANKIVCAQDMTTLPSLPEPEGTHLRSHLQQVSGFSHTASLCDVVCCACSWHCGLVCAELIDLCS